MPRGTLPKETIEYRLLRGENHGSIPHFVLLIRNMPRGTLPKETIKYRLLRGENHGSIPPWEFY